MDIKLRHWFKRTPMICLSWMLTLTTLAQQSEYKVIAYYVGSRNMPVAEIPGNFITHINYAFANIKDGRMVEGHSNDSLKLMELQRLKQKFPHLRVLVSVGGWSWSDHFSDVALTVSSREIFAQSALDFIHKYRLDGIDLDWEYPGQPGEDNVYRPEDKQNFTLLLQSMREKLDGDEQELANHPDHHYLLTIASGANQRYLDHIETPEAARILDFINIITYDFYGSWTSVTGHHTGLYPNTEGGPGDLRNAQTGVEQHLAAGVPANKLVLGTAFYGRGWTGVEVQDEFKLNRPYKGKNVAFSHDSIASMLDGGHFKRYWDQQAKAPYLWHDGESMLISYEDQQSLKHKADFVKERGLAGIMFWKLSQDQKGNLLPVIHSTLSE